MHSASIPGILALDVHSTDTSKVLTGGNDKNATVFNKDTEQVVAILKGHSKKVTKVIYHSNEDIVLTGKWKVRCKIQQDISELSKYSVNECECSESFEHLR